MLENGRRETQRSPEIQAMRNVLAMASHIEYLLLPGVDQYSPKTRINEATVSTYAEAIARSTPEAQATVDDFLDRFRASEDRIALVDGIRMRLEDARKKVNGGTPVFGKVADLAREARFDHIDGPASETVVFSAIDLLADTNNDLGLVGKMMHAMARKDRDAFAKTQRGLETAFITGVLAQRLSR